MRLQDLGFLGFGYAPWGAGTPVVTNPGASNTAAGTQPGVSSGSTPSGLDVGGNGSAAELAVVRESETLKIQLTDGSQVTIRMRAQGAAFDAAQTQADGSSASTAAIFANGQLQVAADGNLSSADMQAISDVVSQVNSLATQFFSGDVQDAFAAAASLNIDPGEIAGFSMKLSYSSTLVQRAAAANTTSAVPVTSDASASGSTPGTPAAGASASSAASNASTSDPPAANPASPQQIITNFIQTVMAKLGRGSDDSESHLRISSRWKLHLLAQALPAYAQAQAADADAPRTTTTTASTTPAAAAQNAPPTAVQATTSAAAATLRVASNRYPTLQAARLAADTLRQLAQ